MTARFSSVVTRGVVGRNGGAASPYIFFMKLPIMAVSIDFSHSRVSGVSHFVPHFFSFLGLHPWLWRSRNRTGVCISYKSMIHIAYSLYFQKIINVFHIFAKFLNFPLRPIFIQFTFFGLICVFFFLSCFAHNAFMLHMLHALHALDAP